MDGLTPIQAQLFALQDLGYRTFHCKLMPTVDPERVIGCPHPSNPSAGQTAVWNPRRRSVPASPPPPVL